MNFWTTPTYDVKHVAEGHPEDSLDEFYGCMFFLALSGNLKEVIL